MGASDRATASGRRRTPSPVASTTCPPCPILNITWPGAADVVVLEVACSSWFASHTDLRTKDPHPPHSRRRAWLSYVPPQTRPRGEDQSRDSTARTADLSTRITTAGALESAAANDWCAGRSRNPEGKVTQTINLRVVRHARARAACDCPCERDNTKLRRPPRHRPGTGTSVPARGRSTVQKADATGNRQQGGVRGISCFL